MMIATKIVAIGLMMAQNGQTGFVYPGSYIDTDPLVQHLLNCGFMKRKQNGLSTDDIYKADLVKDGIKQLQVMAGMKDTGEEDNEVNNIVEEGVCRYKGQHYLCKKDGIYPMPSGPGCERRFILCSNGMANMMACHNDTVFNPEVSICDWPTNVKKCKGHGKEWIFADEETSDDHHKEEDDVIDEEETRYDYRDVFGEDETSDDDHREEDNEIPPRFKTDTLKSSSVKFPKPSFLEP